MIQSLIYTRSTLAHSRVVHGSPRVPLKSHDVHPEVPKFSPMPFVPGRIFQLDTDV